MADKKILDRVAALLAIAEHPNTGEHEADTALRQANKLIAKHSIEEAMLRQAQTLTERRTLARKTITVGAGEFSPYLRTILLSIADANRCSAALSGGSVEVFGADEDIAWIETVFSMIRLQLLLKINPKWDADKALAENIYNFKVAGFKWVDINTVSMNNGNPSMESTKVAAAWSSAEGWHDAACGTGFYHKMLGAYKRHAKLIGDVTPVTTQNQQAYRLSYAESFRSTMVDRFRTMAEEAAEEMDTIPGAAMVMVSHKEEANRMMWDAFPNLDPEVQERRNAEYMERQREAAEARQTMLDAMTPAARQAFLEKEEARERKLDAQSRAYWKKNSFTYDASARAKGAQAAKSIDLSRKAGAAYGSSAKGELK